jgi:hypothetical protein
MLGIRPRPGHALRERGQAVAPYVANDTAM